MLPPRKLHQGFCPDAVLAAPKAMANVRRTHGLYTFFTDDRLHGQYRLFNLPTRAPYLR
jgi:hypothetical protein